jgi:hypothetical protein
VNAYISAFRRWNQEAPDFQASLGYMVRPHLKKKIKKAGASGSYL